MKRNTIIASKTYMSGPHLYGIFQNLSVLRTWNHSVPHDSKALQGIVETQTLAQAIITKTRQDVCPHVPYSSILNCRPKRRSSLQRVKIVRALRPITRTSKYLRLSLLNQGPARWHATAPITAQVQTKTIWGIYLHNHWVAVQIHRENSKTCPNPGY